METRLKSLILETGPIPISVWMTQCLHDRQNGYYATQAGLGRDFITAPETSQIFGELLGLWTAHEWQAMATPDRFTLAEAGPGRGVLMADGLRATRNVSGFANALDLYLIEASTMLRDEQARRLERWSPNWVETIEALPEGPLILLANEFLDCLPMRQFQASEAGWHEQLIALDEAGDFTFGLSAPIQPLKDMPAASPGTVLEYQPALESIILALAEAAAKAPLRALFVDYGPPDEHPGDTLRAYHAGQQVAPLTRPGQVDLTVDVDFRRLKHIAKENGLRVDGPVPQGDFLLRLGAQERLNRLIDAAPERAEKLFAGADKLISNHQMGARFQAICLSSADLPVPAGFGR